MRIKPGRDFPEFNTEYRNLIKDAYWTLKVQLLPVPKSIIEILQRYPDGRNVTHLYIALRLDQSVCSQALALLRKYRLVNTRREGKQIIYTVNQCRMAQISSALDTFFGRSRGEIIGVQWESVVV